MKSDDFCLKNVLGLRGRAAQIPTQGYIEYPPYAYKRISYRLQFLPFFRYEFYANTKSWDLLELLEKLGEASKSSGFSEGTVWRGVGVGRESKVDYGNFQIMTA